MKHKIKMHIFSLETTVNPRLSTPRAAYLFQTHLGRGLFNLAKTMVSALHKGLEYRVKAQVQRVGGHAAEDQKHSKLPSRRIDYPGSVHKNLYTVVIDQYSLAFVSKK